MYEYRNATESNLEAMARVYNLSQRSHPFHRRITPGEMRAMTFGSEGYDAAGAWIVFQNGEPVAFGDAVIEKTAISTGTNEGFIGIEVAHDHRGRGIEQELLSRALSYLTVAGIGKTRAWSYEKDAWRRNLLEENGFKSSRRFYSMVCGGGAPERDFDPPEGIVFSHHMYSDISDDDLSALVAIINETFNDHYGFTPTTVSQEMGYRDSTEDLISVTYAMSDRKIVGFCVSEDSLAFNKERNAREGWIDLVGVVKDLRGKGLGRALIADGMRWLSGRGITTIRLGTDAENRKALELYSSMGFEVALENFVYEKKIQEESVDGRQASAGQEGDDRVKQRG